MFDNLSDIVKVSEAAKALNCSRSYIYQLIQSGMLDGWKDINDKADPSKVAWRITKESLINYISRMTGKAVEP